MFFRIVVFVGTVLLAGIPGASKAQSTATVVAPQTIVEGETPSVPRQLDILDTDYPLRSLLANEEGRVTLNLIIDAQGRVVFGQVLASSGSSSLDQAAVQLARTRWQFQPALKNGEPAVGAARVDVIWKAPLRPAYEYQMDVTLLPRDGQFTFEPAVPATTRAVVASDYPAFAIRSGQQGTVVLKFVILENGRVGDIAVPRSSGSRILDEAAANMVRSRWSYEPAKLNGKPIPMWTHVHVTFSLTPSGVRRQTPARLCDPEPLLGPSITMGPQGGEESVEVSQWVHLTEDGTVDDMLVQTQRGWMHFTPSAVAQYSRAANYPPASRERRPPSCWFNATVVVVPGQASQK